MRMSLCLLCLLALLGTVLCGGCLDEDRFGAGAPFERTAKIQGVMSGEINASEAGTNPMNIQQYLGPGPVICENASNQSVVYKQITT